MLNESAALKAARNHLDRADANLAGAEAELHLVEGLDALEAIVADDTAEARIAANVGLTYVDKARRGLQAALAPRDVPEPVLKRLLRLSQRVDACLFAEHSTVASSTADIARRHIDALLEGYPEADRERLIQTALDRLAGS